MNRFRFLGEIANSMSGTGKVQDEFRLSPAKKQVLIVMGTCPKEKLQGAPAIQI